MRQIYLDYNATTPVAVSVRDAMLPFFCEHFGNPSSGHSIGRAAHEAVEDARTQVARLIGATPDEIIFTSGGTEANNLALKGALTRHPPGEAHLVITAVEHPAIVEPAQFLQRLGYQVSVAPCDRRGVVDAGAVEACLRPNTALVSVMHANNEIGTLQPIRAIGALCRRRGVLFHTDAAQSLGKVLVQVDETPVDLLSIAGHKMYAPKGVGALYVREGVALEPVLHGAAHEGGLRAGTENVPYIVGLGTAASLVGRGLDQTAPRISALRDRLADHLLRDVEGLTIHGAGAARLPNTLCVNFPGVVGGQLLAQAPELCASTGAACHHGAAKLSATLEALGLSPRQAQGTIRLSLGWHTTEDEVNQAASWLIDAWERLR